eukprot:gene8768-6305_t
MQETILDWLNNSGTKSAPEPSAAKSTEEPGSNVDEEEDGENFANKLMADFVDFSWCDEIPVFNEPAAAQASASAPVALSSSTALNQEGSGAVSSTQQSAAQVMLSSGEIISQEHLHDVEYYFERLQKQKPRFVLPSRNSNTDDSEILALHPIDDPTSRLPDPCCVLIGKAAKITCGEQEQHIVLKDVFVHFPLMDGSDGHHQEELARRITSGEKCDMILPEVSVRLASNHLFGK